MSERLKFQGKLAEADLGQKKLRVQISGLIRSLRDLLDPTDPEEDLRYEEIMDQALRLGNSVIELKRVIAEIREIKHLIAG